MLKRMLFAAALTGLMAGVALPLHTTEAAAAHGCWKASKVKYAGSGVLKVFKERRAYRKECRQAYRAYKKAGKAA